MYITTYAFNIEYTLLCFKHFCKLNNLIYYAFVTLSSISYFKFVCANSLNLVVIIKSEV